MDLLSQYDTFITYKEDRLLLGTALLPVYVDDILILRNDCKCIENLKVFLSSSVHMKDLGHPTLPFGLEGNYTNQGIFSPNENI